MDKTILLQRMVRGYIARVHFRKNIKIKRDQAIVFKVASIIIQKYVRRFLIIKIFNAKVIQSKLEKKEKRILAKQRFIQNRKLQSEQVSTL